LLIFEPANSKMKSRSASYTTPFGLHTMETGMEKKKVFEV